MNSDIRLSVGFWSHPKTKKLIKRLGLEGVRSLQILWLWAAQNKADGLLTSMDWEDIELAADWQGQERKFFEQCINVWIDEIDGVYALHDWENIRPLPTADTVRKWDVSRSEWEKLRYAIFERDRYTCQYCGKRIEKPDCDHVLPLCRGGHSVLENLVTACPSCNRSKGPKLPEEWKNGLV